jgi:hypothetical protein
MIKLPLTIRLEQAVYGSFPFWDRGYAILAHSAGCRPQWLAELKAACQRCGEPPAGLAPADSLFTMRLRGGPWMIVGVHPQGSDDQGRPGALAFHALFINPWAYRWIGADPFAFVDCLRGDWSKDDRGRILPAAVWSAAARNVATSTPYHDNDPRLPQVVAALSQGRRVVVQSTEPIDGLARNVWRALPRSVRSRATVATWAFDNANQFDLVGLPKLVGMRLNGSDLILALEHAGR